MQITIFGLYFDFLFGLRASFFFLSSPSLALLFTFLCLCTIGVLIDIDKQMRRNRIEAEMKNHFSHLRKKHSDARLYDVRFVCEFWQNKFNARKSHPTVKPKKKAYSFNAQTTVDSVFLKSNKIVYLK